MQKILFICLVSLLLLLKQQYIQGKGGVYSQNKVNLQINQQEILNDQIIKKDSILKINISGLKGSQDSIEARARYELNLIKENEILIIIPNNINLGSDDV